MKRIVIPYTPRTWAAALHNAVKRFIVLVIHRRGGKTTAALNHIQRDALRASPEKREVYAYFAPYLKQAKRIAWGILKDISRPIPGVRYNETELRVIYPNGSEVWIMGADNPDAIRGFGLYGVVLDEYAQISPLLFTEIITKCVADTGGYILILGTPKGKNHFYRIKEVAGGDKDWVLIECDIDQSLKNESGVTIENLRRALADDRKLVSQGLMTQEELEQEWYNSFDAAIKGAVYITEIRKAKQEKRIGNVPWDPEVPVYTVWDLGIGDAMAIGFYQAVGKEVRMVDYYESTGHGFPHYIKMLKDKPYIYGGHFAPPDIKVREMATGKTRLDAAKGLGIEFEIVPRVSIDDGIDKARALWHRLWVDKTKCELFIDLISSYHREYDEDRNVLRANPVHDYTSHAADQLRYAALVVDQMTIEKLPEETVVEWQAPQQYMGTEGDGDKHPMFKDVDIGSMGHGKAKRAVEKKED